MTRPVIVLAFANDESAHLDLLKRESEDVWRALRDLERQEFITLHREESTTVDNLGDTLAFHRNDVAIFHYAGHANGTTLQLEGGVGHAHGIAGLLGQQTNLQLVFLNGCATRPQVEGLLAAGVKAVIATSVLIQDGKAADLSKAFYEALANRRSIGQAFALAQHFLQTKYGDVQKLGVVTMRDARRADQPTPEPDAIPWALYVQEGARDAVLNWKLPTYRTVGLPPEMIQYIGSSFTANRYVMLVLDEMTKYNPDIYAQMLEQRGGDTVKKDSREYPELLVRNFPWPVGSQVRLLRLHDTPDAERLELLVSAYVRTTQMLYYILLSDLWEQRRACTITVPRDFDAAVPLTKSALDTFDFLARTVALYKLFVEQGVRPYVAEYERVAAAWEDSAHPLQKAHAHLEQLRAAVASDTATTDLAQRCVSAEQAFAVVLRSAAFLARYRMLTVRNIAVDAPRFSTVSYELDLGPLNAAENSALNLYQDVASRRKTQFGNSQSIVLVRDENELGDGLNLSPFIIDKNTFVSVKKSDTTDKDRLAHIFVLSYEEDSELVYVAVEHGLRYALANERDRIHTGMTREDFVEGRNLASRAVVHDDFGFGADFGVAASTTTADSVKVFAILRDQVNDCIADLRAAP